MVHKAPIRNRKPSEEGYMLLAAMFLLALFVLSLSIALPAVTKSIQRDREVETMHRGKQYIRAIQLYYRKFGAYPPSIDALVNTNQIRFLRKRYIDPMTGKDDWKPIMFGQNKAPLAMGFFGQPLGGVGGSPIAGVGPSGSGGIPGMGGTGSTGGSGFGSAFGGGSSFGSSTGSAFGSPTGSSSIFGSSDSGSSTSSGTSSSGTSSTGTDSGSTSGTATGTTSNTGSAFGGSSTTGSGTGFMSGQTGQTFGGGGIVGVEPVLDKKSILIYKTKSRYNQWEFTYSPLMEMQQMSGNTGALGVSTSTPGNGSSTTGTTGSSFGGSSFSGSSFGGSGSSFGSSSGSSFGSSTTPQQ